jgi:hypothetical protein
MDRVIRTLKAQGIYTSCKFLADANFAYKNATGVATLYDISGNNNDATQATGGNQPVWTAAQQNGKAGLVFDGTDDYIQTAAFSSALSQPNTLLAAVKPNGAATDEETICDGLSASRNLLYKNIVAGNWAVYAGGDEVISTVSTVGAFQVMTGIFNGASSELFQNGSSIKTGNPGAAVMDGVTIGQNFTLTGPGNITTGALFFLNAALSTAQRQALETLLNNYYAIY